MPTTADAYWELLAQKGTDGAGAITSVNGTSSGAVTIDQASVDAQSTLTTTRGDAAYVILATDRHVLLTASLTVSRVWQLPAASVYQAGRRLVVRDAIGGVSSTNTLTIQRAGTDTIDGATTLVLDTPWEGAELVSNGADAWSVLAVGSGNTKARRRHSLGLDDTTAAPNVGDTFKWNGSLWVPAKAREVLTANRTLYVRPDGNDSNTGLVNSAGGALLTLNGARAAIAALDLNGFVVTVQVADGTYTTGVSFDGMPPGQTGNQQIVLKGNAAAPGNVIISATSSNCFRVRNGARITVQDMEVRTTTSGACLLALDGGQIIFGNMRFGAAAGPHMEADQHGRIYNAGNYSIVGGAVSHIHITNIGFVLLYGATVTLTGTPAFSAYFLGAAICGGAQIAAMTFSGSATGQRYFVHKNSVIDTGGLTLPGSVAGATATGGQYI